MVLEGRVGGLEGALADGGGLGGAGACIAVLEK